MCAIATACTQHTDDMEFIRDMYENVLYEDYGFLEKHCSESLLDKLSAAYDYDGEGYAVWEFRSGAQDGPSNEHAVISIEDEGDGWYRYTAVDMGITFRKRIKISHKGGKTMVEDIADDYKLIDCGEFPIDPADTIRTGQKLYLENLKDSRRVFFSLNTLVTIENGMITEINRKWIP